MKKIEGIPKNLKELLLNTKYTIHYYQREYKWQRKQIEELIDDLTSEFTEYYKPEHDRKAVADYGAYFMGSIVLAGRENAIIDGQQRFSSLTLLLMYLNNRLKKKGITERMIEGMIFSESYGSNSFNIAVDDRDECMNAIFENKEFDISNAGESVKNLYNRYNDIEELFPTESITDDMLLYFSDWLANRVYFIEIVASTEQDAHKVFVTMNDRGLSLTPTEMLKGYLLSEIKDDDKRKELNELWKDKILSLKKFNDKGDDAFIKDWLRAQYAESIRDSKADAELKDFDFISSSFHKWVHDEREKLGLFDTTDYENFIRKFAKYVEIYQMIHTAETTYDEKTKYVYYNARVNFTLQTQLILASICYEDTQEIIYEKMNLVARFIDIWIASRVTNYHSMDYSTVKKTVFRFVTGIRRLSISELKEKLKGFYAELTYTAVDAIQDFGLNNFSKRYIKNMLARITGYIEEETIGKSNYCDYMVSNSKNPFEIEHIITDHYEWFKEEYTDADDFKRWRNNIGALLLLRKSINASLNDKRYEDKLQKYCSSEGNIYSESLGDTAYKNTPRFSRFIEKYNLLFKPYKKFGKLEIGERNKLVAQLVALIWNDDMFK